MKQEYIQFFELLPKHSQLTLKMLVPSKYPKIDTEILSCICIQHGLIKKIVIDSLKEAADKIVNQTLKTKNEKVELPEFGDMELTDECEILVEDYLYFSQAHSEHINSEIITCYISYVLLNDKRLNSHRFFDQCLYVKDKQAVHNTLSQSLSIIIGTSMSTAIEPYGEYLTNPLIPKHYKCIGREYEIQKTVDVLCRMNKSNVILVGNAGVGKTSVVYGVCNLINSKDCPNALKGYTVFSLSTNKLVSGTTYRGDLEKRLQDIIAILESHPKIILFIDEIHTMFDKTSGESSAATVQSALKPFLQNRSKVIGCTTNSEYMIIEKDKAFERRFYKVKIEEFTKEQTYQTLLNLKQTYTDYHNVCITDDICKYIVNQAGIYIKNRYFPDKAIDILDYSCVLCSNAKQYTITEAHIDEAICKLYNIDIDKSLERIEKVKAKIKQSIIGQDHAVDTVCNSMYKYFLGITSTHKPIASYLLVGATGTGKTELCKQVAHNFFTDESFIRYDMSEFMEPHSVSKIIGSPPGYVGYSSGGSLTEKVKHNPFSIILFDEIEKAHKDVINVLLQIMDDGRLTDSFGTTVDFCNTLIVMTSNIGCKEFLEKSSIGFGTTNNSVIKDKINQYFSPEFRNRLTDIIQFNQITQDIFKQIFEKEMENYIKSWKNNCGVDVCISKKVKQELLSRCYNEKDGVRYIQKSIQRAFDNLIFNNILKNEKTVHINSL